MSTDWQLIMPLPPCASTQRLSQILTRPSDWNQVKYSCTPCEADTMPHAAMTNRRNQIGTQHADLPQPFVISLWGNPREIILAATDGLGCQHQHNRQVYLSRCGIVADQTYRRYSLTGPPSSRISTPTSALISSPTLSSGGGSAGPFATDVTGKAMRKLFK